MQFEEDNTPHLKEWIIKRLENISDADSDVLADYVLALIKSDEPEEQVRASCLENLEDFLREHTGAFVNDLVTTLDSKSYLPGYIPPSKLSAVATSFQPPTGPAQASFFPQADYSRKRGYNEREGSQTQDSHYQNGDRAMKQSRRGGGGGRGGRGGPNSAFGAQNGGYGGYQQNQQQQPMSHMPTMPTPPAGFPPFDPQNPMAAIMAMQAMGFPPLPGLPGLNGSPSPAPPGMIPSIRQRCSSYDTQGFCAAGSSCPYEHGQDSIILPSRTEEYDPANASLSPVQHHNNTNSFDRPQRGGDRGGLGRGRGRGRGRGDFTSNPRGTRAAFSSAGPNNDRSITSIVVEQIPEEKFNDVSVRDFFSEFGSIEEVSMQAYKRLAVVRFSDYAGAKRAYESPKVIFDNRFVKVYWYKPEAVKPGTVGGAASGGVEREQQQLKEEDAEMIDPEVFAQKQAEAQRIHEEKAKKLKEAEAQKEEIAQKIRAAAEERKKLMEKLAAKTKTSASSVAPVAANGEGKSESKVSQTEALRLKLAELEAEAETLGIPAEDASQQFSLSAFRGRGRGAPYIPRGGYRGRGAPGFRGGWRGGAAAPGGAVARLDNRPRSVEVKAMDDGIDFAEEKIGEALRACLFGVGDFTSITPAAKSHVIGADTSAIESDSKPFAIVTFEARYVAEIFINKTKGSGSSISGIGKVEFSWITNDVARAAAEAAGTLPVVDAEEVKDVGMTDVGEVAVNGNGNGNGNGFKMEEKMGEKEEEYDVDDDEDRWMR